MNNKSMNASLYDLTQNIQGQLFMAMQKQFNKTLPPLPPALQIRQGYAESPAWFMMQAAEFAPEPLTIQNIRVRDIYASKRIVQALLELLAGERWLERIGEAFHLTPSGQALIAQLQQRTVTVLETASLPISVELISQLETALGKIIEASLKQHDTTPTWCLAHSRNRAPNKDAHPFVKLSQYFSDFNAYRDDVHMKAWQQYVSDGYIWEAFAHIATKKATSAETVFDALFYRGYAKEDYQSGVDHLLQNGWIEPSEQDAGLDDVDALADLFDKYRQFYEQPANLAGCHTYIKARLENGESTIFMARLKSGEVVGFTQLYDSFCSVAMTPIVYLYDLFVDDSQRRTGVGKALMTRAEQYARDHNASRLTLETSIDNTKAQALYESIGYVRDAEFFTYHFGIGED